MAVYIFYDSFSKMYLIYSTLYYIIAIISTAASYVLISANLDDFKSIASRFIPEEVAGVADVILERAKEAFINDHIDNAAVFRHMNNQKRIVTKSTNTNKTLGSNIKTNSKKSLKNVTKESPIHFKIDLDEFVENIKKKLHAELTKLSPNDNENKKTKLKIKKIKNDRLQRHNGLHVVMKHISRPIKQNRGEVTPTITTRRDNHEQKTNITHEKHKNKHLVDKRYLADVSVGKHPKHILQYGKPNNTVTPKKPNNSIDAFAIKSRKPNILRQKSKYLEVFTNVNRQQNNKQVKIARNNPDEDNKAPFKLNSMYLDTATENTETATDNTETSTVTDLFVGYDLVHTNDSYEDYVTPKKDDDYKEPFVETTTPKADRKVKTFSEMRQGPIIKNAKVIDVFSDVDKIAIKNEDGVHYEDDIVSNPDANDKKNLYESIFHPYVKQFESEINNLNAELGEINKEISSPNPPIFWNVKKTTKNKKGKSKAVTFIPKRDFYKISSPNYLLKVPIIGEKYHFDEPIPEEDRDPENLKYIGNPPASINGKVVFSA